MLEVSFRQIIDEFLFGFLLFVLDAHDQLAFLGPHHHRLAVHPAHHVEGLLRLAP